MRHDLHRDAVLIILISLSAVSAHAEVPANQDTIFIPGGTLHGRENAGLMESTINGDTTPTGARINPNRVYALNEGQYYYQLAPINVYNPTGALAIVGAPSAYGTTKPVILIANSGIQHVVIDAGLGGDVTGATNQVYGSLRFDDVHYQTMELDGFQCGTLFFCGTANNLPQSLTINNCLFEFSFVALFSCTNNLPYRYGIGGWPHGAKFRITNSYFRNMFHADQWWGSRVFECSHPIDTLWIENCTVATGGLTFFQSYALTDFLLINHNTIVNNKKYWLFSPYHKSTFITNNLFINQNWVGEDTNVTNSGQDPDRLWMSTINVDTNNATNGLQTQPRYWLGDSAHFTHALDLNRLQVYVSDNINYYDSLLINGYYNSNKYRYSKINALPSYLVFASCPACPYPIVNVPGIWMNSRTRGLFTAYAPPNGGFIEKRTYTDNPGTVTPGIADAAEVDSMAAWNQNQWGDPRFPWITALQNTKYIYGDYDPTTLPGIVNGVKTDKDTMEGAGITKFTDLTENFSQSTHISQIDGLPIGSLIWDDGKLASYNSATEWSLVYGKYVSEGGLTSVAPIAENIPLKFGLAQNYPNPFNPSTTISYSLPLRVYVTLSVYDVLGRRLEVLVSEVQAAGFHEVLFSGASLSSGVYFYRLSAGSMIAVKKMLLEK